MKTRVLFIVFALGILFTGCVKVDVGGELKQWHTIALTFDGPETSETAEVNPFTYYKLDVSFSNGDVEMVVPGYYAADGNAAITSASSGNKWRVNFVPPLAGEWTYKVQFTKGENIAVSNFGKLGDDAGFVNDYSGTLSVEPSDKPANDLRSKGRLQYVGEHYLQFAGNKEYFLKAGADAPENLLAFEDFDATPNVEDRLKSWEPHTGDYNQDADAYLWGENKDKGKNLLGAINYLASKGMNVFSFLTFNIDGDDRNVFPHLLKVSQEEYQKKCSNKKYRKAWEELVDQTRFDVSKMEQWAKVFEYGESKGMYLHFKTQETENDHSMDGGDLGLTRKLYYREIIARYGHYLALNWNLGEENTQSAKQMKDLMSYVYTIDPYKNHIVLHTFPEKQSLGYEPLLGDASKMTGISMQTMHRDFRFVHDSIVYWRAKSAEAGKKWVVAIDEPGDAGHALVPDDVDPTRYVPRVKALWGGLLAGGAGIEWYFGYKQAHSDLTCEDWRTRDKMWQQSKIAIDFFKDNLPFWEMTNMNELLTGESYCFAKSGEVYAVMLQKGGTESIDLSGVEGEFILKWFDPETGNYDENEETIEGGKTIKLRAPSEKDWVALIKK